MAFVFFSVAISILVLGSLYAYFLMIWGLRISERKTRLYVKIGAFVACFGFIFANFLNHYSDTILLKWIYVISGVGIGVVLNFMVVMTVIFIIYKILRLAFNRFDSRIFGIIGVIFTILFSTYGVWNATYNLDVKEITVKIKNLPEQWRGKKIVQITDLHLGPISGENFVRKIVDKINLLNPDVVVITGDLFDGMDGYSNNKVADFSKLKAPKGVYFVTGNHEVYLGVENAKEALESVNVKVLDNEMVDIDGLQIVGISFSKMFGVEDLKQKILGIKNYDPNEASILLYHSPQGIEDAKAAGIDLQLSGHTHKGQMIPFPFITSAIFGKYYYGLTTEGNYSIYTSSGVGTWGPMMRTSGKSEIVVVTLK